MKRIYNFITDHPRLTLILIFFFALLVRLYRLSDIPHGFHMDEVSNTYIGRFILLSGNDLHNNTWPLLYFDKFGDFPPVLPMYLSGLSTFIFGLNEFSARFPAALIGSLMIFSIYIFTSTFFSKKIAFLASFIVAVFPWHVILSRSSSEGIIGLTCTTFGLAILFKGIVKNKLSNIFISWLFFALSFLLYPSFRLIIPFLFLPLPFIYKDNKMKKKLLILSFVLFSLLTLFISNTTWGKGRFFQTSLFFNPTDYSVIKNDLTLLTNDEGQNNVLVARIFHNKVVGYGQRFITQYLDYFSPQFLYYGNALPQRYSVPHVGLLYLTFLILLLLLLMHRKLEIKNDILFYALYLLFIAPLPAALSVDDFPNVHRSLFMIFPLTLITALSFVNFHYLIKKNALKKILLPAMLVLFCSEIIYSTHQYYNHAGSRETFRRNDGNKQLALYLKENKDKYLKIIMSHSNWFSIYYLFYNNDFSNKYIGQLGKNFMIERIDNIFFTDKQCSTSLSIANIKNSSELIINDGLCPINEKFHEINNIVRRDGTVAFRLFELKKE